MQVFLFNYQSNRHIVFIKRFIDTKWLQLHHKGSSIGVDSKPKMWQANIVQSFHNIPQYQDINRYNKAI